KAIRPIFCPFPCHNDRKSRIDLLGEEEAILYGFQVFISFNETLTRFLIVDAVNTSCALFLFVFGYDLFFSLFFHFLRSPSPCSSTPAPLRCVIIRSGAHPEVHRPLQAHHGINEYLRLFFHWQCRLLPTWHPPEGPPGRWPGSQDRTV